MFLSLFTPPTKIHGRGLGTKISESPHLSELNMRNVQDSPQVMRMFIRSKISDVMDHLRTAHGHRGYKGFGEQDLFSSWIG